MNIQDIKNTLNINTLQLNTATDKDGNKTAWMRHWNNTDRMAVSIHKDTVNAIQADTQLDTLDIQTEIRNGAKGSYTAHRIVAYKPAETTL